jgi:hypothetical protein
MITGGVEAEVAADADDRLGGEIVGAVDDFDALLECGAAAGAPLGPVR